MTWVQTWLDMSPNLRGADAATVLAEVVALGPSAQIQRGHFAPEANAVFDSALAAAIAQGDARAVATLPEAAALAALPGLSVEVLHALLWAETVDLGRSVVVLAVVAELRARLVP